MATVAVTKTACENSLQEKKKTDEIHRTTIFVRNLPFDTRNDQLEKLFAEIGPIKRAFVVKDEDNRTLCRGFGYVQFVLQDDADKAVKWEKSVGNRVLKLSFAAKKPKHQKRKESANRKDGENNATGVNEKVDSETANNSERNIDKNIEVANLTKDLHINGSKKVENELRNTIVITGLKEKVRRKSIRILCEQYGEVEKIVYPVPQRSEVTAFIRFKEYKDAIRATQKIPGLKVKKSSILSAVLLTKEGKHPSKKTMQQSRLIIRNLSFECDTYHLQEVFSKFGKIVNVSIPTKLVNNKPVKIGCGFVQFVSAANANAAIEEMNLKEIRGRQIVVDWAVSKEVYASKPCKENNKESGISGKEEGDKKSKKCRSKEKTKEEEILEKDVLQKDENDEETDVDEEGSYNSDEENNSNSDEDNSNMLEEYAYETEDEDEEEVIDSDLENDSDDDINVRKDSKPKRQLKDAKEGKTVFVRNLSYNVEEEDLNEEFEKYGDIEYVKIVYDQLSGHSKGSAFIKYKDKKSAEDLMDDFKKKEASGVNFVIDRRPVFVSLAVTKGKLGEMQREKSEEKKETDKRNLHLAYEGLISRNSPAAEGLSDADIKKREKALAQKKAKLKNPNFFVSRTRLCVQNLPLTVDTDDLRTALMKHATHEMKIKEIKIMRNKERRDISGKLRSLGYGFIELEAHEDALSLLRATNNNPNVFTEKRRPIVEFSVENAKALKILQMKKDRKQHKNIGTTKSTGNGDVSNSKEEYKVRIEKRREKHLKRIARYKRKRERKLARNIQEPKSVNSVEKIRKTDDKVKKSPLVEEENKIKNIKLGVKRRLPDVMELPGKRRRKIVKNKNENEEEKFNSMVNQYKLKLFGNVIPNASKKKKDSRWFE